MQFLRLRLNGFKSFVDPVDFTIAPGLTGVVGPNGCGKSNLLEALRWVIGENRPNTMRGDGMEDVIFAGAETRPARNFAEVSLSIDNKNHLAPEAFNASEQIEIVRRVTREIGSAYKANGKDIRARDIQMLFADASTGAHSPALVRQGQIAELINAHPKARRRILEEAAGISGLHQRRHEAELKLKAAETNLARVDDVLDALASQLMTLERQARQAARYRKIGIALRSAESQHLYRRWRDAIATLQREETILNERLRALSAAEAKRLKAARLRVEASEAIPPLRIAQANAGARLQHITLEKGALEGEAKRTEATIVELTERIGQIEHDAAREHQLGEDAKRTITRLDSEKNALKAEAEGYEAALAHAQEDANTTLKAIECEEQGATECSERVAQLAARHDSATRLVSDCEKSAEKIETAHQQARQASEDGQRKNREATETLIAAEEALNKARALADKAEESLLKAETERAEIQNREGTARAELSALESTEKALIAEHDALERLVQQDGDNGEALLSEITVEPGFETALGAALDSDLNAPIADRATASGWQVLQDYPTPQPLPKGATPLGDYMRFPASLVRRIKQIGLVAGSQGPILQPLLQPGQRLVSKAGDLWRWDGFTSVATERPTAAGLRLQQINRLKSLKEESNESTEKSLISRGTYTQLKARLDVANTGEARARIKRREADESFAEANRTHARAEAEHSLAQGRLEGFELAIKRQSHEARHAAQALIKAQAALQLLPSLDAARQEGEALRQKVELAREAMLEKTRNFEGLRQAGGMREKRLGEIEIERQSWQKRFKNAAARIADMHRRQENLRDDLEQAKTRPEKLAEKRDALQAAIAEGENALKKAKAGLSGAETAHGETDALERQAARTANEAGVARARTEGLVEAARTASEAVASQINETHEIKPEALGETLKIEANKLEETDILEAQIAKFKRQRDALGAVNLRAEEDASETRTEHDRLKNEKDDLEGAIAKLRQAISNLNREGRQRILKVFDEVNVNFKKLFTTLFGGGTGQLMMVESDDPLKAGLDVFCQPPGKKLSNLSLLSGGEQTLIALALIFAVLLTNPAPICVLDEVDAPLDDANVTRFCDLLDKMIAETETRFLIITHHVITMARMDRLYGATMVEKGVSQLVSVDLKHAEEMVA